MGKNGEAVAAAEPASEPGEVETTADETAGLTEILEAGLSAADAGAEAAGKPEGEEVPAGAEAGAEPVEADEPEERLDLGTVRPETQEKINRRIAKLTAQRKEAREAAAEAEAKATAAEAKAAAAESRLSGDHAEQALGLGLHPEYVKPEELKVLQEAGRVERARAWLWDHLFDPNGYEGDGTVENPSYTQEQIRRRYAEVDRQWQGLGPRAAALREVKSQEMLRHMRLGRAAEAAGWKPAAAKPKPAPAPGARAPAAPPPAPAAAATPGRAVAAAGRPPRGTFSREAFEKDGGGEEALQKQYEAAFG